jgi:protein-S-isoprenylcysteine O-methyltransferase Ste14
MSKRNIVRLAVLCGAIVGVWVTGAGDRFFASVPAFALDRETQSRGEYWAALAGCALFSLYWEAASKGAAPAMSTESKTSRTIHVVLVNLALVMEFLPIRGLGRLLPVSSVIMAIGHLIEASGIALAVWARRHLGRYWSGEIAIKVEHQLIRSGPYSWLRHPIYTGILTMYSGIAIVTGGWLAFVGLALAVAAYGRKIRLEERNLNVAFGSDYEAYRSETWALFPGLL